MHEFAFLHENEAAAVWILSETQRRKTNVSNWLEASGLNSRVSAQTTGDAVFRIASGLSGSLGLTENLKRSSEQEAQVILFAILQNKPSDFPLLYRSIQKSEHFKPRTAIGKISKEVSSLKRFLDSMRLYETTEGLLKSLIDEFGNPREDKARSTELLLLRDEYERFQRESGLFDRPGALELALEGASLARLRELLTNSILPELIVLDQPTFVFPLYQSLWLALAAITKLAVVVDERLKGFNTDFAAEVLPPSIRYSKTVSVFLSKTAERKAEIFFIPQINNDASSVLEYLFDGENAPSALPECLSILPCQSRRHEVRRIAKTLAYAIKEKDAAVEEFHIVALNLDAYLELLQEEFAFVGLKLSLPRTCALRRTAAGTLLWNQLSWLESPTAESLAKYFLSPFTTAPQLSSEARERFLECYSDKLSVLLDSPLMQNYLGSKPLSEVIPGAHRMRVSKLIQALAELKAVYGYLETTNLVEPLLNWQLEKLLAVRRDSGAASKQFEEFFLFLADLAILHAEIQHALELKSLDNPESLERALRKMHYRSRCCLRELKHKLGSEQILLENWVRETRFLRTLLRQTKNTLLFKQSLATHTEPAFQSFLNISRELLAEPISTPTHQNSFVTVSELLDVRALRGKRVIMLGALAESFPPQNAALSKLGTEFEDISERIQDAKSAARGGSVFEAYWLLSHLIRNSSEILITYPESTGDAKAGLGASKLQAAFVQELEEIGSAAPEERHSAGKLLLKEAPVEWLSGRKELELRNPEDTKLPEERKQIIGRAAVLTKARAELKFSDYDGLLNPAVWSGVAASLARGLQARGQNTYSVSDLELLADCPMRFYFSRVLGLAPLFKEPELALAGRVGSFVHKALERFYTKHANLTNTLSRESFADSCQKMLAVADKLFTESDINWDKTKVLRNAKMRIIGGLDALPREVFSGKRGFLKGALFYQLEYIKSTPLHLEYRFGFDSGAPALRIKRDEQELEVRGIIDRIDGTAESEGESEITSIWDYKTSRYAPGLLALEAGSSLQVPLYAAALRQNFSKETPSASSQFGRLPQSGGLIMLGNPNLSGDEASSISKGVLIEHLAVSRKSGRIVYDPEAVSGRIDFAVETALLLDAKLREGCFQQIEETKHCPVCEYKSICARNETLLSQKLSSKDLPPKTLSSQFDSTQLVGEKSVSKKKDAAFELSCEQEAALDTDKSLVLKAGAGSGKTLVLQNRVLKLVIEGAQLESILAITFTEAAAEEIRGRIDEAIRAALNQGEFNGHHLDAAELARLLEAKTALPAAQICTIHAFAAGILRMDRILSNGYSAENILSSGEQRELAQAAVEEVLRREEQAIGEVDVAVELLLDAGVRLKLLSEQLVFLLLSPRKLSALRKTLGLDGAATINGALRVEELLGQLYEAASEEITLELEATLNNWLPNVKHWVEEAVKNELIVDAQAVSFSGLIGKVESLKKVLLSKPTSAEPEWLELLDELIAYLKEHRSQQKKKSKKNPRNYWKELLDKLSSLDYQLLRGRLSRERQSLELSVALCTLADKAAKIYLEKKRESESLDFEDIISVSHQMLTGKGEPLEFGRKDFLRKRLSERYKYIMVDEFQDTDIYQWQIIQAIASSLFLEDGTESLTNVFLVGDAKQGIYGFRGGDVRVLNSASAQIENVEGRVLSLSDNYRSHKGILDFTNAFFDKLFTIDFSEEGEPLVSTAAEPQRMQARRHSPESAEATCDSAVSVLPVRRKSSGRDTERRGDVLEAKQVASFISKTLKESAAEDGKWQRLKSADSKKPVIAVLTRTVKQLLHVASALQLENVPFGISHSSGFWELDEIVQLENLLKALSNPQDVIPLQGVMRSALIGLSDTEILECCAELDGNWSGVFSAELSQQCSPNTARVCNSLQRWRALSMTVPSSKLLLQVLEDAGLEACYQQLDLEQSFINIQRFIEQLHAAETSGRIGADSLDALAWMHARKAEGSAPDANAVNSPVVLMTIHGAKGLEFPMVVLPYLSREKRYEKDFLLAELAGGSLDAPRMLMAVNTEDPNRGYLRGKTLLHRALKQQLRSIESVEERRLFYVACTRAEEYLVLALRESRSFVKEQKDIQELSREQKEKRIFESASPAKWVRSICHLDDVDAPSQWLLDDEDGQISINIL